MPFTSFTKSVSNSNGRVSCLLNISLLKTLLEALIHHNLISAWISQRPIVRSIISRSLNWIEDGSVWGGKYHGHLSPCGFWRWWVKEDWDFLLFIWMVNTTLTHWNLGVRGGVNRANGSCWDTWQEVFWFGALYKSLTCKRESHANCSCLNHNRPRWDLRTAQMPNGLGLKW